MRQAVVIIEKIQKYNLIIRSLDGVFWEKFLLTFRYAILRIFFVRMDLSKKYLVQENWNDQKNFDHNSDQRSLRQIPEIWIVVRRLNKSAIQAP